METVEFHRFCESVPQEIQDFIAAGIVTSTSALPDSYPGPSELEAFQAGYRFNAVTGESVLKVSEAEALALTMQPQIVVGRGFGGSRLRRVELRLTALGASTEFRTDVDEPPSVHEEYGRPEHGMLVVTAIGPQKLKVVQVLREVLGVSRAEALVLARKPEIVVVRGTRPAWLEERLNALGASAEFRPI
ncbi:MAG: hypothetical protein FWD68_13705 [Alphaproteobacteria bacterium]|nr:hypothetical protein [Alphaproteobacteria bacterium]